MLLTGVSTSTTDNVEALWRQRWPQRHPCLEALDVTSVPRDVIIISVSWRHGQCLEALDGERQGSVAARSNWTAPSGSSRTTNTVFLSNNSVIHSDSLKHRSAASSLAYCTYGILRNFQKIHQICR